VACVCFDVACTWSVRAVLWIMANDLEGSLTRHENKSCHEHLESSDFMKTRSTIFIDVILQVGKEW